MRLKEEYIKHKKTFNDYLILIKCGNFYEVLNEDAYVINKIFNYKVKEFKNIVKAGFPVMAINKVIDRLNSLKVNYIMVDNGILLKKKFNKNKYKNYSNKPSKIDRINLIYNKLLEANNDIITKVESIL